MKILPLRPWKVTFADGSYVVVDARSNWEAIKIAKPMSRLPTVDAKLLGNKMRENVAITSEMIKEAKGEGSKLLERLAKLDRNSKEARKIRRQLRRLGISLSKAVEGAVRKGKKRIDKKRVKELRAIEKRAQMELPLRGKADQVLDTAQQLVLAGYKSVKQITDRLAEIYPRIDYPRAAASAKKALFKKNPQISKKRELAYLRFAKRLVDVEGYGSVETVVQRLERQFPYIHPYEAERAARKAFHLEKNPLRKMSLRDAAEKVVTSYLKKQPTRKEYSYWIEAWMSGLISKKELIKKIKALLLGRKGAIPTDFRSNPPTGATEIYGKILSIEAEKGDKSTFPKERFRHEFKPGAKIFGLPDGSILVKSKKRLWKKFKY